MKNFCYITPEMNPMTEELRHNMIQFEKRVQDKNIYIREKRILTSTIVLYILDYPGGSEGELCCGWVYYPETGVENFLGCVSSKNSSKKDAFAEACTDRVLRKHNWLNHDVECVIELRKKQK